MLQFLKYVLATVFGLVIFSVLGFLIVLVFVAGASSGDAIQVKANSVLRLKFDRPIVERSRDKDPFGELSNTFRGEPNPIGLIQIRQAIADAKNDENIKGIYLEPDVFVAMASYPTLEEIRTALVDFKTSKKFIVAYGEIYTEKSLYLASVADKIYLNPAGEVEWNGMNVNLIFLKGTLDKLGVKPEIFKVGDYKSAVEPFLRENMSEPSREQTSSFLGSINDHLVQTIATSRGISAAQLKNLADSLTISDAKDAQTYKLVTDVGYYDEVEAALKKELKLAEKKDINFISLSNYMDAENREKSVSGDADTRIAVIVASGEITGGDGSEEIIGSERIAKALRKAREDDKVKAVVLRINSPGGSSMASDVMWREVMLTKQKKPIVASMSDYAASGGYYMAMGCSKIVAHPTTLTGSIGVFGLFFNPKELLNNKLGVTLDGVKTSPYADLGVPSRDMTDFERRWVQKSVNQVYEDFTTKAAAGRNMSVDKLKSLASGRVWTGEQAKQNGLVDELGGLQEAITLAAKLAKLKSDSYRVRYLPEQKSVLEELFANTSESMQTRAIQNQFGVLAPYVKSVQNIQSWQGIQTRLPYEIQIK